MNSVIGASCVSYSTWAIKCDQIQRVTQLNGRETDLNCAGLSWINITDWNTYLIQAYQIHFKYLFEGQWDHCRPFRGDSGGKMSYMKLWGGQVTPLNYTFTHLLLTALLRSGETRDGGEEPQRTDRKEGPSSFLLFPFKLCPEENIRDTVNRKRKC